MDICISILPTQVDSHAFGKDNSPSNPDAFPYPETRELAEVLRRLERSAPSDPSIDWQESRWRQIEALQGISEADGKTEYLINLLDEAEYEEGGDEHVIFRLDSQPDRIRQPSPG